MNMLGKIGNHPVDSRGFTLLELLVVVSILVLLFGVGIASFNTFNRRERLKQAALNFKSTLRFAQTRAISAEKPASCVTNNSTFVGIRIEFTSNSYTVKHVCSDGNAGTDEATTLTKGVTFSSLPAPFTFAALTRLTNLVSDQTIQLTNGTENYSIQATANGEVNDLGFQ